MCESPNIFISSVSCRNWYFGEELSKIQFSAVSILQNIDEGRLKMKAHCPIVTDFGMREKVVKVLMCYNQVWLQIGLYIILGGESLLPNENSNSKQHTAFLKMVIEKQLFAHVGLARAYAYNKRVDGFYRPGYYETLGNVILKRFLLLVLILDRGKIQSSLPINYGIDGKDGGSPLLFNVKCNIKSSRQMISEFLSSEVMHGEGDLLAHLVIVGYKVSYQQIPQIEYDLRIRDLFQEKSIIYIIMMEFMAFDTGSDTHLDMLLNWMKRHNVTVHCMVWDMSSTSVVWKA
ncbi:uncharacterized protein LOC141649691 [Silene latifolia]|uniref:uncharacterized protein LOC141649691 n=1 Tax=Silene latifolia TaxID=37657 RepID=UPI003D76EDBD